jgi:hypothetical protein
VAAPYIERFDCLFAEHYPAEFARATPSVNIIPGGFDPKLRDKVRRDAALHIAARKAFMLANSAGFTTEVLSDATKKTSDTIPRCSRYWTSSPCRTARRRRWNRPDPRSAS